MKVLFVASLYNNGVKARGHTYEYHNILQPLQRVVDTLEVFDFMEELQTKTREEMNEALWLKVNEFRPDLVFVVPFTDQLEPSVMNTHVFGRNTLRSLRHPILTESENLGMLVSEMLFTPHLAAIIEASKNAICRNGMMSVLWACSIQTEHGICAACGKRAYPLGFGALDGSRDI
jgi:hypothetical protein